jgi:hypothetical protein
MVIWHCDAKIRQIWAHVTEHQPQETSTTLAPRPAEEPSQLIALLPLGASIDDAERQKEVAIADVGEERVQALVVELAAVRKLATQVNGSS